MSEDITACQVYKEAIDAWWELDTYLNRSGFKEEEFAQLDFHMRSMMRRAKDAISRVETWKARTSKNIT